jgi:hypothetical protein
MLNQPKALVAVEDCHVIISTTLRVNTVLRLQEISTGDYVRYKPTSYDKMLSQ